MTNISVQKANSDRANRATLGKDIRAKWDKFSEIEAGALKREGDLVAQLVAKYKLDKPTAESDAKAVVKGRQFVVG
ncbi:MAG: hypothetical protein ABIY37_17635 [Devosia sp.]